MEDALDAAVDILTKQIVKNRKRLETKLYKAAFDDYAGMDLPEGILSQEEFMEYILPIFARKFPGQVKL